MFPRHFLKSYFALFTNHPCGHYIGHWNLEAFDPVFHLLGFNSGGASSGCFVYLFPNCMYETSEFMRSQVKTKVTVERSSEKLKFAKPKKWQDSAKWKVKSQVTDSVQMKASGLFVESLRMVKCLNILASRVKGSSPWNSQLIITCHLLYK